MRIKVFQHPPTPMKLKLGGLTGVYPWTGGKPINSTFSNRQQTQPYSPYCYHLQNPTEAHKQRVAKISINCHCETRFTKDEEDLSLDDLINKLDEHLNSHGMDAKFYLPDPQDASTTPCLCNLLHEDIEFQPKIIVAHFHAKSTLYDEYSMNNMQYSYKALLSILDNSLIKIIQTHLPKEIKFRPILWTFVVCEERSSSFQCVNLLKQALVSHHFTQATGENVNTFTTQFLQICNDLGKNVPSEAPLLLNEQLSTASVEQFHTKFMTKSTKVNDWVYQVHGMSQYMILSMSLEPDYISFDDTIEDGP